jgi:hypothetical protein
MKTLTKLPSILEVTWEDACGQGGWKAPLEAGVVVRSVGYAIKQDKKGICLASGVDPEDGETVLAPGWIPKGMIKRIRKLR